MFKAEAPTAKGITTTKDILSDVGAIAASLAWLPKWTPEIPEIEEWWR